MFCVKKAHGTIIKVIISNSLFPDFRIGINQIDHEESQYSSGF